MTAFSILEKMFLKIESLMCVLRAHINRTLSALDQESQYHTESCTGLATGTKYFRYQLILVYHFIYRYFIYLIHTHTKSLCTIKHYLKNPCLPQNITSIVHCIQRKKKTQYKKQKT